MDVALARNVTIEGGRTYLELAIAGKGGLLNMYYISAGQDVGLVLPSNRTQLEVSSDSVWKCRGSLEFGTMDSNELGCANRNELSYRHCVIAAEVHRQIVDWICTGR